MTEHIPTVRDVERRLPLVAAIVAEARDAVLDGVRTVRAASGADDDGRLARRVDDVRRCMRELEALGGTLADPLEGVVELLADLDGETVVLSWRPAGGGAMTWRHRNGPPSERRPLPAALPAGRGA